MFIKIKTNFFTKIINILILFYYIIKKINNL